MFKKKKKGRWRESFCKKILIYLTKNNQQVYVTVHNTIYSFPQPEVLEQIQNLKELWMDNNSLQILPGV